MVLSEEVACPDASLPTPLLVGTSGCTTTPSAAYDVPLHAVSVVAPPGVP